ncbi:MAG: acyl-CoA dehydrogenase [Pararhodobacter sp.]|nr:acyl-CoA dehydrogenase [Pararhodobacter sp.]
MSDTLVPRELVDFLLFDWLALDKTLMRPEFAELDVGSMRALLDLADRLARDTFLPCYKLADQHEPTLSAAGDVHVPAQTGAALRAYVEAGFLAAPFAPEHGGLGLPEQVQLAATASFMAANLAVSGYAMLTVANARLLVAHATPAQIAAFVAPQLDGRAFGTMCLSEPQAGSSLADVRSRAVHERDDPLGGRYRLHGNKMWISGGDQDITPNIHHLVLAKIPGADGSLPQGTRGLSLFVVPKVLPDGQRNDVVVAGLNHKMGYRGTSNCLLNLGEGTRYTPDGHPGAVGYLIGAPGQGLAIMFHMMNEARLGVGMGAAAVAMRAQALSVDYARTRVQGRLAGSAAPVPIAAHADVARQLTRQAALARAALSIVLFCGALVDERDTAPTPQARTEADALLGLLTPAAKTWASEWGLEVNAIAIQIHGGYGYTRDFDVEQLYRDQRLNPIHEGTTGIQGIDFIGRKILKEQGAGLAPLGRRISATLTQAAGAGLAKEGKELGAAWEHFLSVVKALPDMTQAHWLGLATELLDGFGHVLAGWCLLDQAVLAQQLGRRKDDPSRVLAAHFCASMLPQAHRAFDMVAKPQVPLIDFTTTEGWP